MSASLSKKIGKKGIDLEPIRAGFGRGLLAAGKADPNVVGLCADLIDSTKMNLFADEFPDRFFEVGIAEQNLVTVAAGLARMGKIPFTSSYAAFSPGRNWEQIKTTAGLNEMPVKVIGSHAGLMTGPDGATHQMLEDISLMRTMPNMVVLVPADSIEAEKATIALAKDHLHPGYLRLARDKSPVFTTPKTPFSIGRAHVFRRGNDITLVGCGIMTYHLLEAADQLHDKGIDAEVIHSPSIKPFDSATIVASASKTNAVVTAEEAQITGGLGSAVAEVLSEHHPTPLKRIGVNDRYGETGAPDELFKAFGLDTKSVVKKIEAFYKESK